MNIWMILFYIYITAAYIFCFYMMGIFRKLRKELVEQSVEDMAKSAAWWKEYTEKEMSSGTMDSIDIFHHKEALKKIFGWDINYVLVTPVEELQKQARIQTYKDFNYKLPKDLKEQTK